MSWQWTITKRWPKAFPCNSNTQHPSVWHSRATPLRNRSNQTTRKLRNSVTWQICVTRNWCVPMLCDKNVAWQYARHICMNLWQGSAALSCKSIFLNKWQDSCVTESHEKSTTTCTYSDMKESFDGLVVSSATVGHGYRIHATLPQVRILVLHQAFNERIGFFHSCVHHLHNKTSTLEHIIDADQTIWPKTTSRIPTNIFLFTLSQAKGEWTGLVLASLPVSSWLTSFFSLNSVSGNGIERNKETTSNQHEKWLQLLADYGPRYNICTLHMLVESISFKISRLFTDNNIKRPLAKWVQNVSELQPSLIVAFPPP